MHFNKSWRNELTISIALLKYLDVENSDLETWNICRWIFDCKNVSQKKQRMTDENSQNFPVWRNEEKNISFFLFS